MKIEASSVSETTKRDAGVLESCVQRKFAPAPLWTEAMLAALQRGVKGGKWHSLIDKVSRLDTLMLGFGFRQGLGCKDALREVDRYLKSGHFWVGDVGPTRLL